MQCYREVGQHALLLGGSGAACCITERRWGCMLYYWEEAGQHAVLLGGGGAEA